MDKMIGCALIATLLTGCATTQPCQPIEVLVPVYSPCVGSMPEKPSSALDAITLDSTDFEKIQALAVDWLQQNRYINSLEAVIEGCQ